MKVDQLFFHCVPVICPSMRTEVRMKQSSKSVKIKIYIYLFKRPRRVKAVWSLLETNWFVQQLEAKKLICALSGNFQPAFKKLDFFLLEGIDRIALACTQEKRIKQLCKEWRNGLGEKFKPSLLSPCCTPGRSLCELVTMVRLLVPLLSFKHWKCVCVCVGRLKTCLFPTSSLWEAYRYAVVEEALTSFTLVYVEIQCCENIQLKVLNSKTQNGALNGKSFLFKWGKCWFHNGMAKE